MKTINRNQVESLFPKHIFDRGFDYYVKNRVQGLSYNRNKESWFAEVEGTSMYYVEIDLSNLDNGKIIPYCDCPAFDTYHSCKHIAAVLLEMADQKQELQLSDRTTGAFMDGLLSNATDSIDVLTDKMPMQVEYVLKLDYDSKVWLEWKTGVTHRYVVRNIREFLENLEERELHFFTKKFTFDPNQHYFLTQDEEISTGSVSSVRMDERRPGPAGGCRMEGWYLFHRDNRRLDAWLHRMTSRTALCSSWRASCGTRWSSSTSNPVRAGHSSAPS